jgi:hypothetical protein
MDRAGLLAEYRVAQQLGSDAAGKGLRGIKAMSWPGMESLVRYLAAWYETKAQILFMTDLTIAEPAD